MKFFICLFAIAAAVNYAVATPAGLNDGASNLNTELESSDAQVANQGWTDLTRLRKSAYGGGGAGGGYGGASIPAPPCAKNYLFSCQPNLAPVPCSAPAPAAVYGSAGPYSSSGSW